MGKARDLLNQRFGHLTVVSKTDKRGPQGGIFWHCMCDCGHKDCLHEKDIMGAALVNGKTISCGAGQKDNLAIGQGLNFNDLTGKRSGKLIAKRRVEDVIYNGRSFVQWECDCDCGRSTIVSSNNFVTGNTQSCGMCGDRSHGNLKIARLLDEHGIQYEREKRFDSCRDILPLPFDFYVNNQYCIEFDGKQHFAGKRSRYNTDKIPQHDRYKNQWCAINNMPLIRIPYSHYKKLCIEDLVLDTTTFLVNDADIKPQN